MNDSIQENQTKSLAVSRWFRINLWLHRWTSIIATIPFLILCITGTVLIFHEEIDAALGNTPEATGVVKNQHAFNQPVENVLAAFPEEKVAFIGVEDDNPGLVLLGTVPKEDIAFNNVTRRFAQLATAEITTEFEKEGSSLTSVLFELHAQWFLGAAGLFVGAVIALLVVISLLSGMVVYGPHIKRVAYGTFRRGKGPRLMQLDIHNFIGASVLSWTLVVSLTGFFLGGGGIIVSIWAQNQLKAYQPEDAAVVVDVRRPPITVEEATEAALLAAPEGWSLEVVFWPGMEFTSNYNYAVRVKGKGINERLFRFVLVDAINGNAIRTVELPWYLKIVAISQPMHFGNYGGLLLKMLWTIGAWMTMFITCNGAWLWWSRRGKRRVNSAAGISERVTI